jgi:hypothetical protein
MGLAANNSFTQAIFSAACEAVPLQRSRLQQLSKLYPKML